MNAIASILVGIDFTPGCRAALGEALRIARPANATISAVHVIDTLVASELAEAMSPFAGSVRDGLVTDAMTAWTTFREAIPGAAAVPIEVRIDHRVEGLVGAATRAKADLLVLGARGEPEVGLGTVATACVRHAPCDVLLVRDSQAEPFKSVVACIDFSPTSLVALERAATIAAHDGAALHVLHAFQPPWRQLHYRAPTPEADPHFQQQYRAGLDRRLVAFAGTLGERVSSLKPTFEVADCGGHRSGIVDAAARVGADLIVLGTRGRSTLRDLLLGSTAEKVLRESRCSVLAVRPVARG